VTAAPACPEGSAATEPAELTARVFAALADGRFHSGEDLARALGVTRSAIWKAAGNLRELGAALHAVRNRGYRLPDAGEPLDATRIREHLGADTRGHVRRVEALWSTDSTNSVLLARPDPPTGSSEVLVAEYQSAGHGRRGRPWLAPPGGAVCLSFNWTFQEVPPDLGALSLVMGVCALRAMKELGVADAALKWPNDLMLGARKLGGVLIELRAEAAGPACVVIGIGLNVALGATLLDQIARLGPAATDLKSAGVKASRNEVTAVLVSECLRGLLAFEREGLKAFVGEWNRADALRGRAVDVVTAEGSLAGIARGIDVHGALLIERPDGVRRYIAGDVTVRAAG
jgi:BirA family transcriptional regulator, biotin operon repressor / biotin---[acetyl-CoA-carboxylase] ligase